MDLKPVDPETLARIAERFLALGVSAKELGPVAELIVALQGDMAALRRADLGEEEPALIYSPQEPAP